MSPEEKLKQEEERQTRLVDPLTHPSSGDPPAAVTPEGERLGSAIITPGHEDEAYVPPKKK